MYQVTHFPFTVALTFNDFMTVKGMYVTCYICQVGALSKAEDILEWNMGLVLTHAKILLQQNETVGHVSSDTLCLILWHGVN